MSFENIRVIGNAFETATLDEISFVEAKLNTSFPLGYQDYVTKLGFGAYCSYVRVYMPSRILAEYKEFQNRWNEYYFWDIGEEVLTKEQVIECIIAADTIDGDELIFHPSNSNELFVLPRHDDMIYRIGQDFYKALDWICEAEIIVQKINERYFVTNSWIKANGWYVSENSYE